MPTQFTLSYDSPARSVTIVTGDRILTDIEEVVIRRAGVGKGYDCSVVRAGNNAPVRLVASASSAGRHAVERANGQLAEVAPGFVQVPAGADLSPPSSLAKAVLEFFGGAPDATPASPVQVGSSVAEDIRRLFSAD